MRISAPSNACAAAMRRCRAPSWERGTAEWAVFDHRSADHQPWRSSAMLTGMTTWYRENGRLSLDEIEAIYIRLCPKRLVGGRRRKTEMFNPPET